MGLTLRSIPNTQPRSEISLCFGQSGTANTAILCAVIGKVTKDKLGKLIIGLPARLTYISETESVRRRASTLSQPMTTTLWLTWFLITKNTTARTAKIIKTVTTTGPGTVGPKALPKIQRSTLSGGDSNAISSVHYFSLRVCRCCAAVMNAGAPNRVITTLTVRITRYPGRSAGIRLTCATFTVVRSRTIHS
jgi:hypothetical protein